MIDLAQLISNGMTVSLMALGFMVIYYWHGAFKEAIKTLVLQKRITGRQALISGVYVSFVALMLDNAYWGVTWSLVYLEHPFGIILRDNGVYPNIPSRQVLGIFAAFLHIYAHKLDDDIEIAGQKINVAEFQLVMALFVGVGFSVFLYTIK